MSRNTQYQFVSTDTGALVSSLVAGYERITGTSVQPASPEKLFIQWVADIIIQERIINNCTERFYISEAQETAILIPIGTRVTDASNTLVWETVEDVYVSIGSTYADVQIQCQTAGVVGNDYSAGQINTIIDLFNYYDHCENTTASDDGADAATDDEYYGLMRASQDAYSTAGPKGGYI